MPEYEMVTLPSRIVFVKEHPFGGFDVHLSDDLPRIGYVRQTKAGGPRMNKWVAKAGKRKKGGLPSRTDAVGRVVEWYEASSG